jgi:hypothetical protein
MPSSSNVTALVPGERASTPSVGVGLSSREGSGDVPGAWDCQSREGVRGAWVAMERGEAVPEAEEEEDPSLAFRELEGCMACCGMVDVRLCWRDALLDQSVREDMLWGFASADLTAGTGCKDLVL